MAKPVATRIPALIRCRVVKHRAICTVRLTQARATATRYAITVDGNKIAGGRISAGRTFVTIQVPIPAAIGGWVRLTLS